MVDGGEGVVRAQVSHDCMHVLLHAATCMQLSESVPIMLHATRPLSPQQSVMPNGLSSLHAA